MGRYAIDVTNAGDNSMKHIIVDGLENIRTESRCMSSKNSGQEPGGDRGQDTRHLCLLLSRKLNSSAGFVTFEG